MRGFRTQDPHTHITQPDQNTVSIGVKPKFYKYFCNMETKFENVLSKCVHCEANREKKFAYGF